MLYCVRALLQEVSREGWILWVHGYPPVLENTASLALVSLSDLEQRRLLVWLLWVWIGEGGGGRGGLELGHNMKKMCMRYAPGQVSSNLSKVFLQISKEYFIKLVREYFFNMKMWRYVPRPGFLQRNRECKEGGSIRTLTAWLSIIRFGGIWLFLTEDLWQHSRIILSPPAC